MSHRTFSLLIDLSVSPFVSESVNGAQRRSVNVFSDLKQHILKARWISDLIGQVDRSIVHCLLPACTHKDFRDFGFWPRWGRTVKSWLGTFWLARLLLWSWTGRCLPHVSVRTVGFSHVLRIFLGTRLEVCSSSAFGVLIGFDDHRKWHQCVWKQPTVGGFAAAVVPDFVKGFALRVFLWKLV